VVASVENLIRVAELAARAGAVVKALRKNGNNQAADVIEKECNAACKRIVSVARGRRTRAARARKQMRGGSGRFA
jgi:hypothetical protein